MGWTFDSDGSAYSGELTSRLTLKVGMTDKGARVYNSITSLVFTPPAAWKGGHGLCFTYLRFLYSLKPGQAAGELRLRLMRVGLDDPTAFEDLPVVRIGRTDMRKPSPMREHIKGNHLWVGQWKAPMQLQVHCSPELDRVELTTRYMKAIRKFG